MSLRNKLIQNPKLITDLCDEAKRVWEALPARSTKRSTSFMWEGRKFYVRHTGLRLLVVDAYRKPVAFRYDIPGLDIPPPRKNTEQRIESYGLDSSKGPSERRPRVHNVPSTDLVPQALCGKPVEGNRPCSVIAGHRGPCRLLPSSASFLDPEQAMSDTHAAALHLDDEQPLCGKLIRGGGGKTCTKSRFHFGQCGLMPFITASRKTEN